MSLTTTPQNTESHRSVGLEAPAFRYKAKDRALIIGAGLAGCAVAKTLAARGIRCSLFDANDGPASGASAVPNAVFKPHLSKQTSIEQQFINHCFQRLLIELKQNDTQLQAAGLYQKVRDPSALSHDVHWQHAPRPNRSNSADSLVFAANAGALDPATLCRKWLQNNSIDCHFGTAIDAIHPTEDSWIVTDVAGRERGRGQLLILANAVAAKRFIDFPALVPVAGQISLFDHRSTEPVICDSGCLTPTMNGVWSGATFRQGESAPALSDADDQLNLARCLRFFQPQSHQPLTAWCGVRCTTTDHLPVVGAAPDISHYEASYQDLHHGRRRQQFPAARYQQGLYLLTGLGSRGLVQSLYSAECLADIIFGTDLTPPALRTAIHPARFLIRNLRKSPAIRV